jgi:hypothetical protein
MPPSEGMVYSSLSTVFFSRDGWFLYSFYPLFGRKIQRKEAVSITTPDF